MVENQTLTQLVDALRAEQRRRWLAGERVPAEAYLERHPEVAADELAALELVYSEVLLREGRGEQPRLEEYVARFPWLAPRLRQLFEVHDVLEAGSLGDADASTMPFVRATQPRRDGRAELPPLPGYEILDVLGQGGMGVVYAARQIGTNRPAAVKMILAGGHATPQERARFRVEAEAVGRLQHPNIVQIYEVDEHEGRPYLAMEYVEGTTLARVLAGTPQPAHEAARLVETLARAVSHAHQKGIVHRDLKPANILLQEDLTQRRNGAKEDLAPLRLCVRSSIPKITDFGLAKILIGAEAGQTRSGDVVGTPSYMAPEQAGGKVRTVGPAADIYALGAILYECLTGRPPFKAETPLETLVQVQNDEPVSPGRLRPKLPRDLTTVCLKCLEKEPARRYATAEDLAEDLRRFQAGEPIRARPLGPVGRALKWARRRPLLAGLLAALVLALFASAGAAAWALHQQALTEDARRRAEQNRRRGVDLLDRLMTRFVRDRDWSRNDPATVRARKQLLEDAFTQCQEFFKDEPGDPLVRLQLGRAHVWLANFAQQTDNPTKAESHYAAAVHIWEGLRQEFPGEGLYRQNLARAEQNRGRLLLSQRKLPEAQHCFDRAAEVGRELVASFADERGVYRQDLAENIYYQALLHNNAGRGREAEEAVLRALEIQNVLVEEFKEEADYRFQLATSQELLGAILQRDRTRSSQAREAYARARTIYADLLAHHSQEPQYRQRLAFTHTYLAGMGEAERKLPEAAAEWQLAQGLQQDLVHAFPQRPDYRAQLAGTHLRLGRLYQRMALRPEAGRAYRQALDEYRTLVRSQARPPYQVGLATAAHELTSQLRANQRYSALSCIGQRPLNSAVLLAQHHAELIEVRGLLDEAIRQLEAIPKDRQAAADRDLLRRCQASLTDTLRLLGARGNAQ